MYHNLEVPEQCDELWQTCHALAPELVKDCPIKTQNLKVTTSKPIAPQQKSVYLIKNGTINESFDGQLIVIHEEGDLVNADGLVQPKMTRYENDFAVTVDEYDGATLLEAIFNDSTKFQTWTQYLSCLSQSYQILLCHFGQRDTGFTPEFRHYAKGDVIIEENTEGDEVFTLLSGSAKVMSNANEVGEIHRDEIFGAIAALTNTRRTASIIATTACETIVVKSENFRSLLAARPDTVQQLIQNMARTIVSSNKRIIELSSPEAN